MRLRLTLLLSLIIALPVLMSGQGRVSGKVTDLSTGESLPGVNVIYGPSRGTSTDGEGSYSFRTDDLQITIQFLFVGYKPVNRSVRLTQGEEEVVNIAMEPDVREIDQVIVSAGKTGQKISDITVSAAVIKPFEVARNHLTDAQELVNKSSGIEVLDGQASIRGGSGFSYGAGSRVLALIDGLPAISPDAGNVKWQYLPLENLSQVEIIKGASSVLYGSSALNGVINFRTAAPGAVPVTRFYTEMGIYGNPRNEDWKWWDSPRLFGGLSFSHTRREGRLGISTGMSIITDNSYRKLNDEKIGRMNLKLTRESSDGKFIYGVGLNAGVNRKTDFIQWEDATTGALKQSPGSAQELDGSYLAVDPYFSFQSSPKITHELKMRLQRGENKFLVRDDNNSSSYAIYSEYQFRYEPGTDFSVTAGAVENASKIISEFYGDHTSNNMAAYSQVEVGVFDRLKLSGGVRLEYNVLDGESDNLVPVFRAGMNYRLADYTFLRASFGQGYRYPAIAEKFASTTVGSVLIFPDPTIVAEKGWSSEIGLKQGILAGEWSGQADIALFYSQNKDMIEFEFGTWIDPVTMVPGLGFKANNVENSRVYGVETDIGLNRTAGNTNIALGVSHTFIYPVEYNSYTGRNTDTWLKYRRKHSLKGVFDIRYKKVVWGVAAWVRSPMLSIDDVFLSPTSGEQILPGFIDYWGKNNKTTFVSDLNMGYNLSDRYSLSFVVKNFTNTEYMGRPGDIMPQRNFSIRFSGRL